MSRITIRVRGQADFAKNQAAYLQKVVAGANAGLDDIAKIAKSAMEDECPVDTGLLKSNHDIMPDQKGKYRFIRYLYNDTWYGHFVHEGTRYQEANPWMLRGFYATRSRMLPEMMRA
jgi:HK97 gp10 family phage protein